MAGWGNESVVGREFIRAARPDEHPDESRKDFVCGKSVAGSKSMNFGSRISDFGIGKAANNGHLEFRPLATRLPVGSEL
jgi:hypothetical protein